jgi:hypothetical protein
LQPLPILLVVPEATVRTRHIAAGDNAIKQATEMDDIIFGYETRCLLGEPGAVSMSDRIVEPIRIQGCRQHGQIVDRHAGGRRLGFNALPELTPGDEDDRRLRLRFRWLVVLGQFRQFWLRR